MPSVKATVLIVALALYGIGIPRAAIAQQRDCSDLLAKDLAPTNRRRLRAEDLIVLRDIGPQFLVSANNSFSVSPDGRSLAFEIHKADPSSNGYCIGLAILPLGGAPRLLDEGGELLPATVKSYGLAAIPTGLVDAASPRWAPNGRWIAFLKRFRGSTQVWRANVDGSEAVQLTHSLTDVEEFRIGKDGATILFATRPGLIAADAAIDREGLNGWHFDTRAYPIRSARPLTPDVAPVRYFAVATSTGAARAATEPEVGEFATAAATMAEGSDPARHPVRQGWIEAAKPHGRIAVRDRRGKTILCAAEQCLVEPSTRLWWSGDRQALIFARREGWANSETALYRWTPGRNPPKRLVRTEDDLVECHLAMSDLVCLTEASVAPRHFVSISLDSGRERNLYDPNPDFRNLDLGAVERLHWIAPPGFQAYADLVYPVGYQSGRHYPLIVVQYRTRGFLRGGVGDEFPIQAFANRGYFVLSTENPSYDQLVGTHSSDLEQDRAFNRNFAGRTEILRSIEQELRSLIARGLIDPMRIGITGLSDGSSTVQFAELNGTMFAAGSATGCCWEPTQDAILGPVIAESMHEQGWPSFTEGGSEIWSKISLSRKPDQASFPLLLQAADGEYRAALESYTGLTQAHVPVDLYVFPDEDHVKRQPAHRLAVYGRNLAWFDFWLRGILPTDPTGQQEAKRWEIMKSEAVKR